jgi:hypothetical protein
MKELADDAVDETDVVDVGTNEYVRATAQAVVNIIK